jgi:Domain of unknown function (DUF222)/HNH endonuclease
MCSQVIDGGSDGTRPLEVLEREITALASQIHAATCRWLCLVAEYDVREGWAQWGCRSCAHWVSWQCGIAPGAAREQVRVARRLRELPVVCSAFAAGELSYSKVRALTRVAGVERERELVALARHATASQLERLLRAYRGVVAAERAAAGGRPVRWLVVEHDDDGGVVVRGRFPAEEGALIVAALQAAQQQFADDRGRAGADVPAETPAERAVAGADVPAGTPAEGNGRVADVPAETPADDDERAADVPAGTPRVSISEARADALMAIADSFLASGPAARTGGDRHQVLVHVDAATLSGVDESGRCELEHGAPLAAETARRLACDAAIVRLLERDGKPLRIGRKTRTIPPALRRALRTRDEGCRFPGCGSRRFLDAHHIDHWARGGATDLDNLIHLCGTHHRLLHEGGFHIERRPDDKLTFRRPDGRPIPDCPTAPPGRPARLRPTRRPDACVPLSHDRLDLDLAVDAMLTFAPVASGEPPGV